jgi:hypothetical protein
MKIIGCDFHTRYQQIAMLDQATGELIEQRLEHERAGGRPLAFAPLLMFRRRSRRGARPFDFQGSGS